MNEPFTYGVPPKRRGQYPRAAKAAEPAGPKLGRGKYKRAPKAPDEALESYAGVLLGFLDYCIDNDLDFRETMAQAIAEYKAKRALPRMIA